jgi:quinol monooxygenase YgiN
MFGTIARVKPKPGQEAALQELIDGFWEERGKDVEGAQMGFLFTPKDRTGELYLIAVFDDEKTYMANAGSPDQDAWYQKIRAVLDADPEWMDGTFHMNQR